jgi:hypothetical protein
MPSQLTISCAVLLVTLEDVATMYVVPVPCAVAKPLLLIVATLLLDELQVTASVMSTVLPSSNVPMAVNCWVWSELIETLVGLIAIERKFATVMVTLVDPLMVPDVAVTLTVPGVIPVTKPLSDSEATALSSEDQLTEPVMSLVLPSSYVPVAVICLVLPTETDGVAGVTVMLVNVGSIKNPLQLDRLTVIRMSDKNRSNEFEALA